VANAMLADLAKHNDVTVFSSHDPIEYARLRAANASNAPKQAESSSATCA
jgi:hypothetical protein